MRNVLIPILVLIFFSGCIYTKRTIEVECIEGKIYVSTWQSSVFNVNQDIRLPENVVSQRSLYLDENNKPIKCENF